jgi:hypothetical protein
VVLTWRHITSFLGLQTRSKQFQTVRNISYSVIGDNPEENR